MRAFAHASLDLAAKFRHCDLNGTSTSMMIEQYHLGVFAARTGVQAVHVPFKGASETIPAMLAGDVNFAIDNLASYVSQIESGNMRALAVTSAARSPVARPAASRPGGALREEGAPGSIFSPGEGVDARVLAVIVASAVNAKSVKSFSVKMMSFCQ